MQAKVAKENEGKGLAAVGNIRVAEGGMEGVALERPDDDEGYAVSPLTKGLTRSLSRSVLTALVCTVMPPRASSGRRRRRIPRPSIRGSWASSRHLTRCPTPAKAKAVRVTRALVVATVLVVVPALAAVAAVASRLVLKRTSTSASFRSR